MIRRSFFAIFAAVSTALVQSFTVSIGSNRATVRLSRTSTGTSFDVHLRFPMSKQPPLMHKFPSNSLKMSGSEQYSGRSVKYSSLTPFQQAFSWLQSSQISWSSVHPAMALATNAAIQKGKGGKKGIADSGVSYATSTSSIWYRRFRKLLFNPNNPSMSPDQRFDPGSGVNTRTALFLLVGILIYGTFGSRFSEKMTEWKLLREVEKEKNYREQMVYDAVKLIKQKLAEPKLKATVREDLNKQLKELDPKGEISAYLDGKGPKPNLKEFIDTITKNAANKGKKGGVKRKKITNKPPPPPSSNTPKTVTPPPTTRSSYLDDDDEDDVKDEDDDDSDFDERRMQLDEERARREAMNIVSSPTNTIRSNNGNNNGVEKGSEKDVNRLMSELRDSLSDELTGAELMRLTRNLKDRLMSLDNSKRLATMSKIEEKLEDSSYWQGYLEKLK